MRCQSLSFSLSFSVINPLPALSIRLGVDKRKRQHLGRLGGVVHVQDYVKIWLRSVWPALLRRTSVNRWHRLLRARSGRHIIGSDMTSRTEGCALHGSRSGGTWFGGDDRGRAGAPLLPDHEASLVVFHHTPALYQVVEPLHADAFHPVDLLTASLLPSLSLPLFRFASGTRRVQFDQGHKWYLVNSGQFFAVCPGFQML